MASLRSMSVLYLFYITTIFNNTSTIFNYSNTISNTIYYHLKYNLLPCGVMCFSKNNNHQKYIQLLALSTNA